MEEGLDVGINEFRKMNRKSKDDVIFLNVKHIRGQVCNSNTHEKVQYIWLFLLTVVMGLKRFLPI